MNGRQNDNTLVSKRIILMALGFGSAALLVKTIGLSIPIFDTVGLDPRELVHSCTARRLTDIPGCAYCERFVDGIYL